MIKLCEQIDTNKILNNIYYLHGDDILDGMMNNADDESINLNISLLNTYRRLLGVKKDYDLIFIRPEELTNINNIKYDTFETYLDVSIDDICSNSKEYNRKNYIAKHYICNINGSEYNFILEMNGADDMIIIDYKSFNNFITDFANDNRIIHIGEW